MRQTGFRMRGRHCRHAAINAHRSNLSPVVQMNRRSVRIPRRRHPRFQRGEQVTNVLGIDALADFGSTTPAIGANGWERSRATGQGHVNGVVAERFGYFG